MLSIVHAPSSENVKAFAWEKGTLYIQFRKNGLTYLYEGVAEHLFHDMRTAESVGKFFHKHIRHHFTGIPVEAAVAKSLGFDDFSHAGVCVA